MTDYFEALGLNRQTAKPEDVKAAFRAIICSLHPDRAPENAEKAALVTHAYNELSRSEAFFEDCRYGICGKSFQPWRQQYDAAFGIVRAAPAGRTRNPAADDINRLIRDMERRRREARAQRDAAAAGRKRAEEGYKPPTWEEAWAAYESKARAASEEPRSDRDFEPEPGKCGHPTTSGPCCRPEGHSPNGHMSQKVADTKRENAKRKRQGKR